MENFDLSCEIIFTDDLFLKVNKHFVNKKRKGILLYFISVTYLTVLFLLLDVFGPDNIHTLYGGFFFMGFSFSSLVALFKTRNSAIKRKIINNRKSFLIKSIYSFNEERIIVESESEYSKAKIQYHYNAITNMEKVKDTILLIYFKDERTAIINSNNLEEIYNYVNVKIKKF